MDQELCIEIAKHKDKHHELIITVSITRTYVVTDHIAFINENSDHHGASCEENLVQSFVL
jgi:hypothetical protein